VPVGYLFLSQPPEETVPIPDFRTFAHRAVIRPSPNLLDMIYAGQERQSWYRDFARVSGESKIDFVGSTSVNMRPETVAARMRETLGFEDAKHISRDHFDMAWPQECKRLLGLAQARKGGGGFYRATIARVGRRFVRALVVSTREGQTPYRDAFRMLGIKKTKTFSSIRREIGVHDLAANASAM